jgi:hypothetical protein
MTEFGTDHLDGIIKCVCDLQPSRVYYCSKLKKIKIKFSLHSASELYLTLLKFYQISRKLQFVDIPYQCRRQIKKKIPRFLHFCPLLRSLFYCYYIRHIWVHPHWASGTLLAPRLPLPLGSKGGRPLSQKMPHDTRARPAVCRLLSVHFKEAPVA